MTKPLSPTQTQILTTATDHAAGLAAAPPGLPVAARNSVFRSMLNSGLLEEMLAPAELGDFGWRQEENGTWIALRITSAGLHAIGVEPEAAAMAEEAPQEDLGRQQAANIIQEASMVACGPAGSCNSLRDAAAALLVAWDAGLGRPALPASIEALRAALRGHRGKGRLPRNPSATRLPREGTKHQTILGLLRRAEGTTIAQIMEATG